MLLFGIELQIEDKPVEENNTLMDTCNQHTDGTFLKATVAAVKDE